MTFAFDLILFIVGPLLIGSIPFGLIVGRLLYRSDIRQSGSGNIGAANALRSYGKGAGFAVLVLDGLKGLVPVILAPLVFGSWVGFGIAPIVGAAAVLGHCFSPWLHFKGGKGVATWLGALFGISWIAALAFIVIWLVVVIPTRYAALGSMIAAALTPVTLWLVFRTPGFAEDPNKWILPSVVAALIAILIVWKHRENIVRLREGREIKLMLDRKTS